MKKLVFIFTMILTVSIMKAQNINKTKVDEKSQMEVLTGLCNRDGLKSNLFKTYYESEYNSYTPDTATIKKLKKLIADKKITVTIVMGSWCGDSQEQVPRFYKIIDALNFSEKNVTLYCVDRSKKTDNGETDNLAITLVPTFIFYNDGKEIGRIIESPKKSIEKEMLKIIS